MQIDQFNAVDAGSRNRDMELERVMYPIGTMAARKKIKLPELSKVSDSIVRDAEEKSFDSFMQVHSAVALPGATRLCVSSLPCSSVLGPLAGVTGQVLLLQAPRGLHANAGRAPLASRALQVPRGHRVTLPSSPDAFLNRVSVLCIAGGARRTPASRSRTRLSTRTFRPSPTSTRRIGLPSSRPDP